jgi:hypothetical protein
MESADIPSRQPANPPGDQRVVNWLPDIRRAESNFRRSAIPHSSSLRILSHQPEATCQI